jgi:hypothetical protein
MAVTAAVLLTRDIYSCRQQPEGGLTGDALLGRSPAFDSGIAGGRASLGLPVRQQDAAHAAQGHMRSVDGVHRYKA